MYKYITRIGTDYPRHVTTAMLTTALFTRQMTASNGPAVWINGLLKSPALRSPKIIIRVPTRLNQ